MIRNKKQIKKEKTLYSDVFFQTYKLSKAVPKYKKGVPLTDEDENKVLREFMKVMEVLEKLKLKKDLHKASWELLDNLLQNEVIHIQDTHTIDLEDTYYTVLNLWVCLENWERSYLDVLFPVGLTMIQLQNQWPKDEKETKMALNKLLIQVSLERNSMKRKKEVMDEDVDTYQAVLDLLVPIIVNVLALILFWYAMNH